jgi:putative nucleotidyltransferase with HDIG domain
LAISSQNSPIWHQSCKKKGKAMNRKQALAIVNQYVKNPNLVKHMLAVEAAMRFYARKFGEDEEKWAVTGLLHDFDWEIHPTMEEHPSAGEPILREHGVPEEIIRAIQSHATHTGIPRKTLMERDLFACDEITGLITAVALVRPSRALYDLKTKSVKKKWKDKSFAAGANREEMEQGASELGIDLWEHVGNVIKAMESVAVDLDLAGSPSEE